MRAVFETQVCARHFGALLCLGQSMAPAAFPIVVRFFMTIEAILGRRQMQRTFFARGCSTRMTTSAMNSLEHMCAMLECASSRWSDAQNGRTRGRK
jgi:hypothetical protein